MVHMEADMVEIEPEREDEREDENIELTLEAVAEILGSQNVENVDASKISHLNLDRQRIGRVPNSVLSGFKSVTNLYLQHNSIEALDFCSELEALRFLCVSHNRLRSVGGLRDLQALRVLDVSSNLIESVDVSDLPSSLQFILLKGNPCAGEGNFDALLATMGGMPNLIEMDGKRLRSTAALKDGKLFSFGSRSRGAGGALSAAEDRVARMERQVEEEIEREIELEKARLMMSQDTHLSNEVERIKNTIGMHSDATTSAQVNFRPAIDGLMHHARTEMVNKVDAMKERCRIRRLNTQEYSDEISQQISKMKQQLKAKPFKAAGGATSSRPATASSSQEP